jgi:cation diffusion facilitator CzcD-associated flavoprotein CzcO
MGSTMRPDGPFTIKQVAVIGAGPTGLAAAKYLLAEGVFEQIDVYEQQGEVGGVWNYTPLLAESVPIPQTTPQVPPEKPIWQKGAAYPVFSNPMYERLNTNIPKGLMQFSDQDFPVESLLYPSRQDVQTYLIQYSQSIRHLILFSTQVEEVRLAQENGQDQWTLVSRSTLTNQTTTKSYDAIVVSNGHYSVPWIPDVPGIKDFHATYPSIITHSKIYRSPESFTNKKVVVVGGAASGLDISNQISVVCQKPLLNSIRETARVEPGQEVTKEEVPAIAEYLVAERGVRFENGRVETDIDAIVYCTGYMYSYPFLESLDPPLVTDGRRAIGIWQQIFNIAHPTLAFTALGQKIIPFPMAEAQGAAISKVWSKKLSLLTTKEMEAWEMSRVDELGDGTAFNVYGYPKDADYINYLHDWVMSADSEVTKEPPFWDEKAKWVREIYSDVKKKFTEAGGKAKSLEELGFNFETREQGRGFDNRQ